MRFGQPQVSSLVTRKLLDTRILTVAAPRYLKRFGWPQQPSELLQHRCIQFRDPGSGRPFVAEGRLVELFGDWPDERFGLYALYPSRHNPPAKVRAFLDVVLEVVAEPG